MRRKWRNSENLFRKMMMYAMLIVLFFTVNSCQDNDSAVDYPMVTAVTSTTVPGVAVTTTTTTTVPTVTTSTIVLATTTTVLASTTTVLATTTTTSTTIPTAVVDTSFKLSSLSIDRLKKQGIPDATIAKLQILQDQVYQNQTDFVAALEQTIGKSDTVTYKSVILNNAVDASLPVIVPNKNEIPFGHLKLTLDELNNITGGDSKGLTIDLGDTSLWGTISVSQYPFAAGKSGYDYEDFIDKFGTLTGGKGTLPISQFYTTTYDANNWLKGGQSTATPTIEYRLDLLQGSEAYFGLYGSFVSFDKNADGTFRKLPTIIEGPFVTLISSDDPTSVTIVWETDELCSGEVRLGAVSYSETGGNTKTHSVKISGLTPNTEFEYYVKSKAADGREVSSNTYKSRTAPVKGEGSVVFAVINDGRAGAGGGGERDYMGVNLYVVKQLVADAYRNDANFLLFGGDLIWGFTSFKDDFILQMKAWKQEMAPFWRTRPVYAAMGDHEFGWQFDEGDLVLDRWPYATDSGEAVFASQVFNPTNGPEPSDPRRPTYRENVFTFQYGPVLIVSVNNSYWWTEAFVNASAPSLYGGCPAGYIMEDQLKWIESTLNTAEKDSTVKFVFILAHVPAFPISKHVSSAMWYKGDNKVRAYTKNKNTGSLEPEALGIIEIRNRFWKAIAGSSKTVAFFGGDEHCYQRTLINDKTPVGVYPSDDTNGDGVLEKYSPNPDFVRPVWHIAAGGGGAPYVANVESVPWTPEIITSQYGYVLVKAEGNKATIQYIANPLGEVLDKVEVTK